MTSNSPLPRRAALVVGSATLLVLAYAGPAAADIPVGWSDPPPVPVLRDLLHLHRHPAADHRWRSSRRSTCRVSSAASRWRPAGAHTDDQWFGGRRATAELESSTAGREADETESARDTGGASGTW